MRACVRKKEAVSENDVVASLKRMAPIVDQHEKDRRYPDGLFAELGEAGLLGLPYPTEWDGGGQPYEVYLQVLEELGARWAAVAVAVSVHGLACHPLFNFGTDEQKVQWLERIASGDVVASFALTEPEAGSDVAALAMTARKDGDSYVLDGRKTFISNGGIAGFYTVFARTGEAEEGHPRLEAGEPDRADRRGDGFLAEPAHREVLGEGFAQAVGLGDDEVARHREAS